MTHRMNCLEFSDHVADQLLGEYETLYQILNCVKQASQKSMEHDFLNILALINSSITEIISNKQTFIQKILQHLTSHSRHNDQTGISSANKVANLIQQPGRVDDSMCKCASRSSELKDHQCGTGTNDNSFVQMGKMMCQQLPPGFHGKLMYERQTENGTEKFSAEAFQQISPPVGRPWGFDSRQQSHSSGYQSNYGTAASPTLSFFNDRDPNAMELFNNNDIPQTSTPRTFDYNVATTSSGELDYPSTNTRSKKSPLAKSSSYDAHEKRNRNDSYPISKSKTETNLFRPANHYDSENEYESEKAKRSFDPPFEKIQAQREVVREFIHKRCDPDPGFWYEFERFGLKLNDVTINRIDVRLTPKGFANQHEKVFAWIKQKELEHESPSTIREELINALKSLNHH